MKTVFLILLFLSISWNGFTQINDTIFIKFDDKYEGTKKESYEFSPNSSISYGYFIKQMEEKTYGDTHFFFSHANRDDRTYEKFGGQPPIFLKKHKSFLNNIQVLDMEFFNTTPYLEICKTFEEDNSRKQDVVVFMIDLDEMENDSIILREVKFSRPVKE